MTRLMGRRHPAQPPLAWNSTARSEDNLPTGHVWGLPASAHSLFLPPHLSFVASLSEPTEARSPRAGQALTYLPTSPSTDEDSEAIL